MARLLLALMLLVLAAPASAQQRVLGIDHIPVVVKDLARARADFTALGFTLKPGRPHADGLENAHVKFADGSEIELISPTTAADALSSQYLDWLREGDGPISLGLYRPGSTNTPPPGIFFDARQHSPTDLTEHFEHANGAASLFAVWLAGSPAERKLVNLPGAKVTEETVCAPFGSAAKLVRFKEGEVPLLPESAQIVPGRPIVAATIAVKSLDAAHGYLDGKGKRYRQMAGCGRPGLWVESHGLWLEFSER
jgi:hypothetical protein